MSGSSSPILVKEAEASSPAEKKGRFDVASDFSDVVLSVGGSEFHVNKQQLARQSKVFHKTFYGEDKKDSSKPVEILNIAPDFEDFLELVYGYTNVNAKNMSSIIQWAHYYECEELIEKCGDFLMENSEMTKAERLEWACLCKMDNVKNKILAEIKKNEEEAAEPRSVSQNEVAQQPLQGAMLLNNLRNDRGQNEATERRGFADLDINAPEFNNIPTISYLFNLSKRARQEDD